MYYVNMRLQFCQALFVKKEQISYEICSFFGADNGNRTRILGLGSPRSTTELYLQIFIKSMMNYILLILLFQSFFQNSTKFGRKWVFVFYKNLDLLKIIM